MNINSSNEQIVEKKKISSWVLGIISIGLSILGSFIITGVINELAIRGIAGYSETDKTGKTITVVYYGLVLIFSIFGFVRAIIELKSPKKRLAIRGLVICFFSIAVLLYMAYLSLAFYAL